jgi:MFS family permease
MAMTRRRYWVFFLLFLFNVICYLDRINMSVAGRSVATEFGLSPISLGYLFSSFLWAYVAMMLPGGKLVDTLGAHRMAWIGAAFWSVAQMLSGAAVGYWSLLATRLGLGVGEAPTFPVSYRGVRDWAPYSERGVAVGCIQAGTLLGPALSAPLVAWLIAETSWRISFVVTGAVGLVWVLVWRALVSTPEDTKWIPEAERQKILTERHGTEPVTDDQGVGYLGLIRSPSMWGLFLSQGCGVYTVYLYLSWLPDYLQTARGLSIMKSGIFTMVPFLVGAVVIVVMNLIGDRILTPATMRTGKRRIIVVTCLVLSALGMLIPYTESLTMLVVLTIFPISFGGTSTSTNAALCNDLLRNKADAGKAFAFMVQGGLG